MKLSYLLMEIKLVLIYWTMNTLKSLMSLIQPQINQPFINFQHSIRKIGRSLLSIKKRPSQLKAPLMNSSAIRIDMEHPRSISVYEEGRATSIHILKRFVPDLIKSDLWFHILKFASQINLSPPRKFVEL